MGACLAMALPWSCVIFGAEILKCLRQKSQLVRTALANSPEWQHLGPQRQQPRVSLFCSFLIWISGPGAVQERLLSKGREGNSGRQKEPDGKFQGLSINSSFVWVEPSPTNPHPVALCPTAEAGPRQACEGESWPWGPDGSGRKSRVHLTHRPRIQGRSFLSPRRELVMMVDFSVQP